MNLTESQLFTIEALNRVEGFVWPNGAEYAVECDRENQCSAVVFACGGKVIDSITLESSSIILGDSSVSFTRRQFESVDGWVRVSESIGDLIHGDTPVDVKHYLESKGFQSGSMAKFIKWDDVKLWRYHRPQKENRMTLLEILVCELPKRGGWPDFAESCVQSVEGMINFIGIGHGLIYRKNNEWECDSSNYNYEVDFHSKQLATDHATKIVTRAEYEAAVNSKRVINAGEAEITMPGKVHQTEIKATVSIDEQQSIEQLYDEYRKACIKLDEAKESVAWSTAQRDEALNKIKSWHKERGFDVSEVKLKFEPVVNVDVRLTDPSGKSVPWINHNEPNIASKEVRDKAPFGATHYDDEYDGRYLQHIGESWMMYVKGDWIKCDPDTDVLSRLFVIR